MADYIFLFLSEVSLFKSYFMEFKTGFPRFNTMLFIVLGPGNGALWIMYFFPFFLLL